MKEILDTYLLHFAKLRTDTNKKSWTPNTFHRSPYKPFLLLSVLDLVAHGYISENFIEPGIELTETWLEYIKKLPPMNRQPSIAYPFFYLKSDGFWHLLSRPGIKMERCQNICTLKKLRDCYFGAKLDEALFSLLRVQTAREQLRAAIITTYFSPEIQPYLKEQAVFNYEVADYSANLLATSDVSPPFTTPDKSILNKRRKKSAITALEKPLSSSTIIVAPCVESGS